MTPLPQHADPLANQLAEQATTPTGQGSLLDQGLPVESLPTDDAVAHTAVADAAPVVDRMLEVFHGYIGVFVVAFLVTLVATPIMRRLAIANGVIDRPDNRRKAHKIPVAYLGGAAVYLGLLVGILFSYLAADSALLNAHETVRGQRVIPFSFVLGMTIIMVIGLIDDVVGVSPRYKIAGQLIAAAALAMEDVGVKVASGVMRPIGALLGNSDLLFLVPVPVGVPIMGGSDISIDLIYWTGTAIIAIFILGACNAANLIDGLDGLLSGVTAISAAGLLLISLGLALADDGVLDSTRIVLCLALLGACLGFLPHNFRPATIFLGDAGSHLLGFVTIVIILTLGDTGKTPLVVAGLLVYSLPIIDTTLAIVRRKMAGVSISAADDQHLHHMLRRAVGVTGAVFILYGISSVFAALGVWVSTGRARVAYTVALVFAAYIGVTAVKIARRAKIEQEALAPRRRAGAASPPTPAAPAGDSREHPSPI
jgi:UDP-GlcNAc:undecaprenyl-phosphate GlcNAc-1-phosphate transferase